VVQPVLTKYCASCHNSSTTSYYNITYTNPVTGNVTTFHIPTLDLTDTPVTVYYDKKVATYPASYVSLYYPATLQMDGMDNIKVEGTVPPEWMIPEDARDSVLISKLNIQAEDGTYAWPKATNPPHPEDKGITMSAVDRQILVRTADLGGQFWSRQNTGFVPYNNDPTAGTKY